MGPKGRGSCHYALCVLQQQHCDLELGKVCAAQPAVPQGSRLVRLLPEQHTRSGLLLLGTGKLVPLCAVNSHGGLIKGCTSSIQAGTLRHAGPVDVPGLVPHHRRWPTVLPNRRSRSTLPRDAQR
jgi:hypothetical protein